MRDIHKIFTLTLLLIVTKSSGQTISCDTIYSNPETMPKYKNDFTDLLDYLNTDLVPIIKNCMQRDNNLTGSLYVILTIDSTGKLIDATFPRHNLTSLCKDDLKTKFLTMKGWTAGQKDQKPICSTYYWPISCLKWE